MIKRLLHIESTKTLHYPAFKTIIILHALLFLLVAFVANNLRINIQGITIEKIFQFPHIWNTLTWIASWFNLLLGIVAIILVTNEFQFNTFRKQLIDGLTRNELLLGKFMVFVFLSFYTMLLVLLVGLLFGLFKTPNFSLSNFALGLPFLPVLLLQSLGYMLLGMLFAFLLKSTALSIVSFILYFFPVEPIIRTIIPDVISQHLPVKVIANLTPMPDFVGISIGDFVQINGETGPGLYNLGILSQQLPLIISSSIVIGYCVLFLLLSKLIVKFKNF